jgi:hypothetical protein
MEIRKLNTTSYHPRTNGLTERLNKTMVDMISLCTNDDQDDWDELLPLLCFAYNTSVHASTAVTPFEVIYAHRANFPIDVVLSPDSTSLEADLDYVKSLQDKFKDIHEKVKFTIQRAQGKQAEEFARKYPKRRDTFEIGEHVMMFAEEPDGKLDSRWYGPYVVVAKHGPVVYKLQRLDNPDEFEVANVETLKKFYDRDYWLSEDDKDSTNLNTTGVLNSTSGSQISDDDAQFAVNGNSAVGLESSRSMFVDDGLSTKETSADVLKSRASKSNGDGFATTKTTADVLKPRASNSSSDDVRTVAADVLKPGASRSTNDAIIIDENFVQDYSQPDVHSGKGVKGKEVIDEIIDADFVEGSLENEPLRSVVFDSDLYLPEKEKKKKKKKNERPEIFDSLAEREAKKHAKLFVPNLDPKMEIESILDSRWMGNGRRAVREVHVKFAKTKIPIWMPEPQARLFKGWSSGDWGNRNRIGLVIVVSKAESKRPRL